MVTGISQVSETTPLLAQDGLQAEQGAQNADYDSDVEEGHKKDPDLQTNWRIESKLLAKYSTPLFVTYLLQYSFQTTTVIVAGRLGTNELGAVSLATMTANVTGLAIYEGLATSLDTLCSQAYGGGKKELVGLHMQRMVYLLLLVTVPVGAVWLSSPWILEALVPEKELAQLAGTYLRIYLIGMPGFATFEAGKRLVQAQGDFTGSLVVLFICAPLNVLLNWLFVFARFSLTGMIKTKHLRWGFTGAPLAVAISNTLQPILLIVYVRFIAPSNLQCWPGLTTAAFRNWLPMIRLAAPGVMMTLCEWLAFDILSFSAAYLSNVHLAAQSVLMTVCVLMYHIPFPISIAATTRFGNLIGHGALAAARTATYTYTAIFTILGLVDTTLLLLLTPILPRLFSTDPKVQAAVSAVVPVVAAAQFFDATTALCNGLVRGLGAQAVGGLINLGVYYLLAVPLALFLAFGPPQLSLAGLWIGPCSGLAVITLFEGSYVKWSNWQRAVDDAKDREE